jgi:tRNA threonylcarbamoyladenosine biosynthesis protein TsaE
MKKVVSENQMSSVAETLLETLRPQKNGATVLALSGDLGAGKTTLTQHFAQLLKVKENIISPTFVIMKSYPLQGQKWETLIHIDAYRIEQEKEMQVLGLHRLLADPKNLILIEWPEKITGLLPENKIDVLIEHDGEGRKVSTQL